MKVWNQIHQENRDCIIAICGGTGSGKSTIALWLAEKLDIDYKGNSRFDPERIVFGFNEWVKVLAKDHVGGTAIIMEEPQAYFNSRTFQSKQNLEAIIKFSTGRIFRYLYILTYPSFDRIDLQLRERLHFAIITNEIDKKKKVNRWTPYEVMPNWLPNKPPVKFPMRTRENGLKFRVVCETGLPSEKLLESYTIKSLNWKTAVKTGQIDQKGDLTGTLEEVEAKGEDRRLRVILDRKENTRKDDLVYIEAEKLWGVSSAMEIVRKTGVYWGKANRLYQLIKEKEGEDGLKVNRAEIIEKLLARD